MKSLTSFMSAVISVEAIIVLSLSNIQVASPSFNAQENSVNVKKGSSAFDWKVAHILPVELSKNSCVGCPTSH
jgi:hypothetical protein